MRILTTLGLGLAMLMTVSGCGKPAEEPAVPTSAAPAQEASAPAPAPQPASTPAPVAEPIPATQAAPALALPEGFTAHFHAHPDMTLKSAETIDADKAYYKVTGELRGSTAAVLNYYMKYFQDNGWEEDMVMEHEGNSNTVASYKKDGYLQYVEASEGGLGAKITITTGRE